MNPPRKPFSNYKWQWAVLTPTEGLNDPPVFLGILRTMRDFEGKKPSDPTFNKTLAVVQQQTRTNVKLERSPKRNLIRNSGQYWKALDLIDDIHGEIKLTTFGRKVADGCITSAEFASTIVKTLELPNSRIDTNLLPWKEARLKIKPLELLLNILIELDQHKGSAESYITPIELVKIIIPLAGENANVEKHVDAIILYRKGKLDISSWPDCAPRANDKRMAREFLLFLTYYGFCRQEKTGKEQKFHLDSLEPQEVKDLVNVKSIRNNSMKTLELVRKSNFAEVVERKKILAEVYVRPQQPKFRRDVMEAYHNKCMITRNELPAVLEAAHIVPAKDKGKSTVDNGLCLRADIHLLFDSGHLRIDPDGNIHLSDSAKKSADYSDLPLHIIFPRFVSIENVKWRWNYT